MAVHEVIIFPDPRLHAECEPVEKVDAGVRRLVEDLAETMYAAGGVGLAAPQIGVPKRVAVIDVGPMGGPEKLYAIINPELVEARGEVTVSEGCLSFPDINEDVVRAKAVVVRALDADGNEQVIAADTDTEGILPVALQHELDHLEGVLLIDRLSVLRRELIKRRMRKNRRAASGR